MNSDRSGLAFRLGGSKRRVEGATYQFYTIDIFPESGLEKLQLIMVAFLVARGQVSM